VFSAKALAQLAKDHQDLFKDLSDIGKVLNRRFADMESEIRCLLLSVACGESMLLIGPPGTAKSRLVRAFANLIGLVEDRELSREVKTPANSGKLNAFEKPNRYFEYLLTPFTEPGELFGYFDVASAMKAENAGEGMKRLDKGMMQYAEVIFLDEVFNGSSAILNSLLTFVNEGKFHDRGQSYEVNLSCLFGATNHPPKRQELIAIYDRFLLRCWVDNARSETADIARLFAAGWKETNAALIDQKFEKTLQRAALFRNAVRHLSQQADGLSIDASDPATGELLTHVADMVELARRRRYSQMSNRRLVRFMKVFLTNALLRAHEKKGAAAAVGREDLMLLARYGLDKMCGPHEQDEFRSLLERGGKL
jgi:MoxR-like ATPase